MHVLFILAALTYGAASFAYGLDPDEPDSASRSLVARSATRRQRQAHLVLFLAALLHFCTIGAQCVRGEHPFESVFLATSLGALITVAGFIPIGLNSSAAGEFTFSLFVVIAVSLIASWIVAVLFSPLLGVTLLPARVKHHSGNPGWLRRRRACSVRWAHRRGRLPGCPGRAAGHVRGDDP